MFSCQLLAIVGSSQRRISGTQYSQESIDQCLMRLLLSKHLLGSDNNDWMCHRDSLFVTHVGIGLYPLAAMINHSCQPNTAQSFRGRTVLFTALRQIARGEEITITYVEVKSTRQHLLDKSVFVPHVRCKLRSCLDGCAVTPQLDIQGAIGRSCTQSMTFVGAAGSRAKNARATCRFRSPRCRV